MTAKDKIIVNIDADLEEIVPGFLDNRRKDIKVLVSALEQGDFEAIRILGHTMKGNGGGYGFDTISRIGLFLEKAALERNSNEVEELVRELSFYLEHIEIVYV